MKRPLFKIKTFGCKLNQYEEQLIRERLLRAGYQEAEKDQAAGLCIVNTCTVTQKADKECRETLRRFIRENPKAEIMAAGCYTQRDPEAIEAIDSRIEALDNKSKLEILKFLNTESENTIPGISYFKDHDRAFIKVQNGCNNFCSYCIVPYVRGRSISRDPKDIIEEAKQLIKNGYKEVVLTGICLGNFGKDLKENITLTWLIKKISNIDADFRIRLSSIEIADVSDDLINEMVSSKKLCAHLHIPLQSGDNQILKAMNRRYAVEEFTKRIEYIRSKIKDVAINTDLIIGFPNETGQQFLNTIDTIKKIKPSRTHIFTYSPRKNTEAFNLKDNISPQIKKERFKQIREITDSYSKEFSIRLSQREQRVLVEGRRDKITGFLTGYTDRYIKVLVDAPDGFIGNLIQKRPAQNKI